MIAVPRVALLPRLLALPIPKPVAGALERVLGIREVESIYGTLRATPGARPLAGELLRHLQVTCDIADADLRQIPAHGPAVLVVNHPSGILEGAVLSAILSGVRPDVRFLANGVLAAAIPEIRGQLIAVDPMGGAAARRANPAAIRQSLGHLTDGGLLVVFPAGEVSHYQWRERAVTDPPWNPAVARILTIAGRRLGNVPAVPVYVDGVNSLLFQAAGLIHPRLRTALLIRELLNKRRSRVNVRAGSPVPAERLLRIPTDAGRTRYLRWRTYLLAARAGYKPRTRLPEPGRKRHVPPQALAEAAPREALAREVAALPPGALLARSGNLSAYCAGAAEIPAVLAEIGRLRELAFRAAGEGTGKHTDLDEFDAHYRHLFVWNEPAGEVAGAYRLASTADVRARFGLRGLYTATLFDYGAEFLDRMGPALELGRSFVRPEYQKAFAPLLLLWKGIGAWVARHPEHRILFGPVSISNRYQAISRELMVAFLERHASLRDWAGLVKTRNPLRRAQPPNRLPHGELELDDLAAAVSDIEPSRAGVPVLLRQYLKLGGRLLGFNVDPKFSGALDGLILVDLARTDPKLLERYLGRSEAEQFIAFQKGTHGTLESLPHR